MHTALIWTPVLLFLPLLAFAVPVVFRLLRPCRVSELTPEWLESFHASSYLPMQGLLAAEDFQFLSRQPGYDSSLHRKLRRDRILIFRQYLNRLIVDFNRLHRLARVVISRTEEDRSDLLIRLIRLRLDFSLAVLKVECSYLLCRLNVGSMSVRDLLLKLDEMTSQLGLLSSTNLLSANL